VKYDRIIKNGMIVDGTNQPRFLGDIGIKNGMIAKMGHIDKYEDTEVLDATGMVVAPGFIDLHTHYDAQIFWDPYCSISGWHGVTSVVIGNCGFGFAPMLPENREKAMLSMTRIEAIPYASMKSGLPWDWVTFPEFLKSVERIPKAVNVLPYVPVGPMLAWVLGYEDAKAGRKPTDAEHVELCRLLEESMDAGGCGWSAQIQRPGLYIQRDHDGTPMITDVMHNETCYEFAKVLRHRNEGFMQAVIISSNLDEDEKFYEDLALISGRPMIMNAVIVNANDPEVHRRRLRWLNSCRERGIRVLGQGLTVNIDITFKLDDMNLFDECEEWMEVTMGSLEERKAKMADPARRAGLRGHMPYANFASYDGIKVVECKLEKNKKWLNCTLKEIGEKTGKHIVDVMLDMAVEENLETVFYGDGVNHNLEFLKEVACDPYVIFGVSDGGAHTRFLTAGRFPTDTIVRLVRDNNVITLEEAHWRLSGLPAQYAGFHGRGTLKEGAPADIIVYDYNNLKMHDEEIVHDMPANEWRRICRACGYRYVLVNGEITIKDDKEMKVYPGELLRHGGETKVAGAEREAA
jgi:N-acyl-D-aspartate/D-glutamate deacylase